MQFKKLLNEKRALEERNNKLLAELNEAIDDKTQIVTERTKDAAKILHLTCELFDLDK